ncbi:hypothetical protein H8356DRAFT_1322371 [Neocallimastix lanati (nom. inval.)]|nr:hypothetical protein H8356DRAFT_1322371 [Neocallimastix sp. JGI-2020a]
MYHLLWVPMRKDYLNSRNNEVELLEFEFVGIKMKNFFVTANEIWQRRNSDTHSNDNYYPNGVIIDELQKKLQAISSSKLIT